jgi:hypothetical protein
MAALAELGIHVAIGDMPSELPEPIRFSQDHKHASYDPDAAQRFLQILVNVDWVFKQFRTGFLRAGGAIDYPAVYSYAYPEQAGSRAVKVRPEAAFFSDPGRIHSALRRRAHGGATGSGNARISAKRL